VHAGDAPNAIPTRAELSASIRTPLTSVWDALPAAVDLELRDLVEPLGASAAVRYTRGVPPVVNDPGAIATVRASVVDALGEEAVADTAQSWGGDDFAWYAQRVPSAYVRLGTHDPADTGPRLDLHAGHFDVDERAIGVGVRVLVAAVERHLATRGQAQPSRKGGRPKSAKSSG
jgi:amidohydrolase